MKRLLLITADAQVSAVVCQLTDYAVITLQPTPEITFIEEAAREIDILLVDFAFVQQVHTTSGYSLGQLLPRSVPLLLLLQPHETSAATAYLQPDVDILYLPLQIEFLRHRLHRLTQYEEFTAQQIGTLYSELLGFLGHELRSPLTVIKSYTNLLQRDNLPRDKMPGIHAIMEQNAVRLERLLEEFLQKARAGAGILHLHPQPHTLDVAEVDNILQATRLFRDETDRPTYALQIAADLPPLYVDWYIFRLMLAALFSDIHTVYNNKSHLTIGVAHELETAHWQIMLDGLRWGTSTKYPTNALTGDNWVDNGAFVRRIIELHQGKLWLEQSPDKTTRIHFTLPLVKELPS